MPSGVEYLALLRGVNVGGTNLVKTAEPRAAFEELGFADVATYIASGNVLFRAPRQKLAELAARLESELSSRFGLELKVVVLTEARLRAVIEAAPDGFGGKSHRCDVIFLRAPLTAKQSFAVVETKEGVDSVFQAGHAAGYKNMTIRSWSTTTKLLGLMDSGAAGEA